MSISYDDDDKLIDSYRNGDQDAFYDLLEKYKGLVRKKAKAMYIAGGDEEDLIQEGMIGLYKAVKSYNKELNPSFLSFASMCVDRQIITAVKAANRKKHGPLNSYVSFDSKVSSGNEDSDNETLLIDTFESIAIRSPEDIFLENADKEDLERAMPGILSQFEMNVAVLYLSGKSYVEIAAKLSKSPKSIDNALQRIKNKLINI